MKTETALEHRLEEALQIAFEGATVRLETIPPRRVGGEIEWHGFEGQEQIERQRKLRDVIRNQFDSTEQLAITAILTFTPHEVAAMSEEAELHQD